MNIYSELLPLLNNSLMIFLYSLVGGLLPALFWLWFWLHEGSKHDEPKKIILFVFLLGMLGVFVSFFLQKMLAVYFSFQINDIGDYVRSIDNNNIVNLIFVIIEEFIKYLCAYMIFFRTKLFYRPINAFIYIVTATLGFVAMENSLYLIKPLIEGQTIDAIINSHIRFVGANVLHVASSGILSLFIGYSFYKKTLIREMYIWLGLVLAILLHWIFNIIIINHPQSIIFLFSSVWIVIIFLIFSLEKIKKIKYNT